jgi:catechol 2,3-dioxygenase-like lactoylglutathione lyase family enzyme
MLADSLAVTTVAVTDIDRAKRFYQEQVGLKLLDETPAGFRFGAGKGSQLSVRRGQPNVGQTRRNVFGVREGPVPVAG